MQSKIESGAPRQDIQALRGIAVLSVVFYHANVGAAAGYLGVDVFFVISGYLITTLICRDLDQSRFSFVDFYRRRARRLLPAAFVTVFFTAILVSLLGSSTEIKSFIPQAIGALTFTANFVLAAQTEYFAPAADLQSLLHMWSLAVEEQYYLLAPALLWACPRRWRSPLVVTVFLLSVILCFAFAHSKPAFAFYMLPARAWELAVGAYLALKPRAITSPVLRELLGSAAVLAIGVLLLVVVDPVHPRLGALLVCVATALVIHTSPSVVSRGPLGGGLAAVGDISYSLYLVHWPIFSLFHFVYLDAAPLSIRLALVAAALVFAVLLFALVERPFHRSARRIPVVAYGAAAIIAAVSIGAPRLSLELSHDKDWIALRAPVLGFDGRCEDAVTNQEIRQRCRSTDTPTIAVWGDSFAMHLIPGLVAQDIGTDQARGRETRLGIQQLTQPTCPPVLVDARDGNSSCDRFNRRAMEFLRANPGIKVVILSTVRPPAPLQRTIAELKQAGKKVILVAPTPSIGVDMSLCVERLLSHKPMLQAPENCSFPKREAVRMAYDSIQQADWIAANLDVPVIRPSDAFCDEQVCRSHDGHAPFLRDVGHLSNYGSLYFADRMKLLDRVKAELREQEN